MLRIVKRPIGRILRDAGILSEEQLERALEEQKQSKELLGQVLVRMGLLEHGLLKAALSIQEHLASLDQAVRLAAGMRQMLGALLVRAGKMTPEQLDLAVAEQKRQGGKLGEICVRQGYLSPGELEAVLAFQRGQETATPKSHPLRLGELLVAAGHITRDQLETSLRKQLGSRKKLGEVLVEEGYAQPSQVTHGIQLQHLLVTSVLAAALSATTLTLGGCGGGGNAAVANPAAVTSPIAAPEAADLVAENVFTVTSESYPLIRPTFYYSTDNSSFWSIQANVAKTATDPDTVCVARIDIPKTGAPFPSLDKTFSIEEGSAFEKFPGTFTVFNGMKSVDKKVEKGTISFTRDSAASGRVRGTFAVTLTDYDSYTVPAPRYQLKGSFRFMMNSYGPAAGVI